jgi:hypothetical protein
MLRLVFGAVLSLLTLTSVASAAELAVGDTLPVIALPDQHDRVEALPADTRVLVFAADKVASDLVNGFLKAQPDDFMARRQAAYLADISSMPSLITRMFALPRMRDRPYRIRLAYEADDAAFLPRRTGNASVIYLDGGRVTDVHYAADEAALRDALDRGGPS